MYYLKNPQRTQVQPLADIVEIENGISILIDIPGVEKDNIFIEVENSYLFLKASMEDHISLPYPPLLHDNEKAHEREIKLMEWVEVDYFLQIYLSDGLDKENIFVYLKNGILVINLEYTRNYSKKTQPYFLNKFLF